MQNFIIRITQKNFLLTERAEIGCFILPDTLEDAFAGEFVHKARQNGKLALVAGQAALNKYAAWQADGLIIDTSKEAAPQKVLKVAKEKAPQALIGAVVRNRRHEAMLASEAEPDFVIFRVWADGFAATQELLTWYSELFLIQCAAQIEEPCAYAALSADFIILDDTQWQK